MAQTEQIGAGARKRPEWELRSRAPRLSYDLGILVVAAAIFAAFAFTTPHFLEGENLLNIVRQVSLTGICAIGLTFVMIAAEIDLSIGSQYALLAGIMAKLTIEYGWNPWLAAAAIILFGMGFGLFHGFITQKFKVPSFIVTLAGLGGYLGIYNLMTGGASITGLNSETYSKITGGYAGQVPVQAFWLAGVGLVFWFVLSFTRFGYDVYAVGGNKKAAKGVGINVSWVKTKCFMIGGGLVGLAGALNLGWIRAATPQTGASLLLDAVAAIIIGGTSLFGGSGSVRGTIVGLLILGMVSNGLVLQGVTPFWDPVAKAVIIVIAVLLGSLLKRDSDD